MFQERSWTRRTGESAYALGNGTNFRIAPSSNPALNAGTSLFWHFLHDTSKKINSRVAPPYHRASGSNARLNASAWRKNIHRSRPLRSPRAMEVPRDRQWYGLLKSAFETL
jgi:hypothetical protein